MNTLEKQKFFGVYIGQNVAKETKHENSPTINVSCVFEIGKVHDYHLELKHLSKITDEEIQQVCMMAHNIEGKANFEITRTDNGGFDEIHCYYVQDNISVKYHVCLNYDLGTVNSNVFFQKTEIEEAKNYKSNIGEVNFSSSRVVGYIQILDFLRSKGYAVPYANYLVKDLVKMGWVKLIN